MPAKSVKERKSPIGSIVQEFVDSRRAMGATTGTVLFYHQNMLKLQQFCAEEKIEYIEDLDANQVTKYLLWMERSGHNPGGVHIAFRTVRTLVLWYKRFYANPFYVNPMEKVTPPKQPKQILEPIPLENIRALLDVCPTNRYEGIRDRAIFRVLVDTGVRAAEFLAMNYGDLNMGTGVITIPHGKGNKRRTVFIGIKTRRAIRAYLNWRERLEGDAPLWCSSVGVRLTYSGLRDMVQDRADAARVPRPPLHAFRRTFAVEALRGGMNPFALAGILGHEDMQVTRLYVKLVYEDLQKEHVKASPGDRL